MEVRNTAGKASIGVKLDASIPADKQLMDWIDGNNWGTCTVTMAFSGGNEMGLTIRPIKKESKLPRKK